MGENGDDWLDDLSTDVKGIFISVPELSMVHLSNRVGLFPVPMSFRVKPSESSVLFVYGSPGIPQMA
ncbi:hypothetical protein ETAA8_57880 [Anatilimnocola aggregata]|uniref:Uncharacterized protein n=1 Tax=Anatilimnocola aggregata TaxID=2528021 RepID=A0A517YK98_9BACT|nr:hypothetical protein ETAA8_57880 [Anatilimnocola aggregata]